MTFLGEYGPSHILPVQCCCEPGRRFGWVYVPKVQAGFVHFGLRPSLALMLEPVPVPTQTEILTTEIAVHQSTPYPARPYQCDNGGLHYTVPLVVKRLAVSSGDYPIEVWRRVYDFMETPMGRRQHR